MSGVPPDVLLARLEVELVTLKVALEGGRLDTATQALQRAISLTTQIREAR